MNSPRALTILLRDIVTHMDETVLTIGDFMDALHERGFGILIFLFALPMALPIPVPPGINLLFSTPLLFLTFQQIYGAKAPWLPLRMRRKPISKAGLDMLVTRAAPWLDRLSFLIRPRLGWMTQGLFSHLIGVFGFLFTLCVCIPVPLTNTVPSMAIALMAVGVLIRDGLAILGGMILGSVWIALLMTLGIAGFKALINTLI